MSEMKHHTALPYLQHVCSKHSSSVVDHALTSHHTTSNYVQFVGLVTNLDNYFPWCEGLQLQAHAQLNQEVLLTVGKIPTVPRPQARINTATCLQTTMVSTSGRCYPARSLSLMDSLQYSSAHPIHMIRICCTHATRLIRCATFVMKLPQIPNPLTAGLRRYLCSQAGTHHGQQGMP